MPGSEREQHGDDYEEFQMVRALFRRDLGKRKAQICPIQALQSRGVLPQGIEWAQVDGAYAA